jgi:hypothetical protein
MMVMVMMNDELSEYEGSTRMTPCEVLSQKAMRERSTEHLANISKR